MVAFPFGILKVHMWMDPHYVVNNTDVSESRHIFLDFLTSWLFGTYARIHRYYYDIR